jgi:hypothetical protein
VSGQDLLLKGKQWPQVEFVDDGPGREGSRYARQSMPAASRTTWRTPRPTASTTCWSKNGVRPAKVQCRLFQSAEDPSSRAGPSRGSCEPGELSTPVAADTK